MIDADLQACVNGDKRAWDAFVVRWAGVVVAAVRRTVRGRRGEIVGAAGMDIEDIVQEVFVRLVRDDYRLLKTFNGERASLSTWLTLVARSTAIDRLRGRRLPPTPLTQHAPPAAPPHGDAAASGGRGGDDPPVIPLHVLSERQRLVLRMLFDEDMSVREAAAMLQVDEQTIRSTKHKALERLRAAMGAADRDQLGDRPPASGNTSSAGREDPSRSHSQAQSPPSARGG